MSEKDSFPALNLPHYDLKTKAIDGIAHVFDPIRKKHLVLTPEEYVRQHLILYLINDLKFPKSWMKTESGLKVNTMQKRSDVLVYQRNTELLMLVECKAAKVPIDTNAWNQASIYNTKLKAPFVLLSNGLEHYMAQYYATENRYRFLNDLLNYEDLCLQLQSS